MESLIKHVMARYIPPELKGPDAPCADSGYTWRNGHTDLTACGRITQRNGNSGCITAAQIRSLVKNTDGEECLIISVSNGRTTTGKANSSVFSQRLGKRLNSVAAVWKERGKANDSKSKIQM